jgi:hypothetical protein
MEFGYAVCDQFGLLAAGTDRGTVVVFLKLEVSCEYCFHIWCLFRGKHAASPQLVL